MSSENFELDTHHFDGGNVSDTRFDGGHTVSHPGFGSAIAWFAFFAIAVVIGGISKFRETTDVMVATAVN